MAKNIKEPNPWSKVVRHIGLLWGTASAGFATFLYADAIGGEGEVGIINSAVGAIIGVMVATGVLVHRKIKQFTHPEGYQQEPKDDINNPWNARVKAGVVCGEGIGRTLFLWVPIPLAEKPLLILGSAVGGFLGGLIALLIPGWKPMVGETSQRLELNPSSERIRSGAMYGSCFGIVLGVFFILIPGVWDISTFILLGSGMGAAIGSGLAYLFNEKDFPEGNLEKPGKHHQNPWSKRIRAGIQWAACLGILLGALFPGLGLGLSMNLTVIVSGALFSIVGGLVALVAEPLLTSPLTKNLFNKDYETANAWGPRCRAGVAWGTCLGMLIGCIVSPGFVGATAGGAIGGLGVGLAAVVCEPLYLLLLKCGLKGTEDDKEVYEKVYKVVDSDNPLCATENPWSERCRTATLVCGAIGALIGFFVFSPLSLGFFCCGAIGGVCGGVAAYFLPPSEVPAVQEDGVDRQSIGYIQADSAADNNEGSGSEIEYYPLFDNGNNGLEEQGGAFRKYLIL